MNVLWEHLPYGPGANLPFYDFGDSNYAVARWDASGVEFQEWGLCSTREAIPWSDPMPLSKASDTLRRLLRSPISLRNAVAIFNVVSVETLRIGFCRTAAEIEDTVAPTWFDNPKGGLGSFRRHLPRTSRYERVMEDEDDE